ncbi:ferredoxin [Nocardioides sp.]|uniref:ferredoxin n=1 Tax=Nocardioides sp. TaxID=35761 RepID=UPI0035194CF7
MTRLHLDWTRCDGHGGCAELLPDLLTLDPWGYPLLRGTGPGADRDAEVPRGTESAVRHAARACPRAALRLLDGTA